MGHVTHPIPRVVRWAPLALLGYRLQPIDLIPDVIPGLGITDGLIIAALVLRLMIHRARVERSADTGQQPVSDGDMSCGNSGAVRGTSVPGNQPDSDICAWNLQCGRPERRFPSGNQYGWRGSRGQPPG
ncbi:YkvA family protein [Microbacterium sp. P05]|uniref:YkvA family protein n=1 Tax=Microbacterium sp. P05 TaxID=3366948 RepID=UPI003746D8CE